MVAPIKFILEILLYVNHPSTYCIISISPTGDDKDPFLKKAYQSVFIFSLLNPAVNNTDFQNEIKSRALNDYGFEFQKDELVSTQSNYSS